MIRKIKKKTWRVYSEKSTLYDLARKGNIPAHKMGREWRFDAEELDERLKAGKLAGTSNASQNGCHDEE